MQLNKTKEKTIEDIKKELELKKISHPFEDDLLGLKPFAETISNIVVSTKDPFVFSINSPYGTGKTFFLRRLHCLLEQKGCLCVSYNAWESDFYDNPLIALISELINNLKANSKDFENIEKEGIELSSASVGFSFLFNADINLQQKENLLNSYKNYKDLKYKFISALQKFTENLEKPLVFIIDELDRCRPDYAIKTLETIKHFFNIPNIVFIIGVDRKQIESTVKVLYGTNIDNNCDEYLRKFIDQDFYLPYTKNEKYIEKLCIDYLKPIIQTFIRENLETYTRPQVFSILNIDSLSHLNDAYLLDPPNNNERTCFAVLNIIFEYVCALSDFFHFSLRKQEQFVLFLGLFFQSLDMKRDPIYPELACLLTAIRLNDYNDILSDDVTIFNLMVNFAISKIPNSQKEKDFIKKMGGSLNREKLLSIVQRTSYRISNTDVTTNSIVAWGRLYFDDNSHQNKLLQNNSSQAGIDKYRNIIKQLTILTTEN